MKAEALIDLDTYLERAPNPQAKGLRFEWHMKKYYLAEKILRKIHRVADVGCGWGFGAGWLSNHAEHIFGFDINPALIPYARQKFSAPNIQFQVHDILNGPLPGRPFDLICMFEVIEHLEDPDLALRNIKNSLSQGGHFLLSTPNVLDDETAEHESFHPHHCSEFNVASFAQLLNDHFQRIDKYSQGVKRLRKKYEGISRTSPFLSILRKLDPLKLRTYISPKIRKTIESRAVGISYEEVLRDDIEIVDGWHEESIWLLADCQHRK